MEKEQIKNTGHLIIIGGSSGSLDALLSILPSLKKNFSIPIVVVLHRSLQADNSLADLLASRTLLHVKEADEKDVLEKNWLYIAPPDYHLLIEDDGSLALDHSEKINYSRPSIDVSFISAAAAYKNRLTAILLSGANADGAAGLKTVSECGGKTMVQNPAEAIVSYMPEQAISLYHSHLIVNTADIATMLNNMC